MPNMYIRAGWPDGVVDELRTCFLQVQNIVSGRRVWDWLFSSVERAKLGNEFLTAWADGGIVRMWTSVRGGSAHRAVIDMARSLTLIDETKHRWLLAETGEMSDDDIALMNAANSADLVLTAVPRCVFWQGIPIEIDWDKHQSFWDYLRTLAIAAQRCKRIDASDFLKSNESDGDYHVKIKLRLIAMAHFPTDLADLIVSLSNGRQILDLPPESISVLKMVSKVAIRESV